MYSVVPPPEFTNVLVAVNGNSAEESCKTPCPRNAFSPLVKLYDPISRCPPSLIVRSIDALEILDERDIVLPDKITTTSFTPGTADPSCNVPLGSVVHVVDVLQSPV
jgi:hypothetical protein